MLTLRQVLTALGESGVRLGAAKCQFFTQSTTFMGRHITQKGILPDPKNIEAIINLSPPSNRKELLSCLGMLGWVSSWISSNISENVAEYCGGTENGRLAPTCADLRRLAPTCADLRRLAPTCADLRRLAPTCADLRRLASVDFQNLS
jgi:hypothetical protein